MRKFTRKQEIECKISKLEDQIIKGDRDFDDEQGKKVKRTFFALYGIVVFVTLFSMLEDGVNLSDIGIIDIIAEILLFTLVTGIVAVTIMFVSYWVWNDVHQGAMHRVETIAKLEGELFSLRYYIMSYIKSDDEIISRLECALWRMETISKMERKLSSIKYDIKSNIEADDEIIAQLHWEFHELKHDIKKCQELLGLGYDYMEEEDN